MVDKLQKLSVDYYDRQPVGVLMSRVAHDTEALYGFIHQFTSGFLLQILHLDGDRHLTLALNLVRRSGSESGVEGDVS